MEILGILLMIIGGITMLVGGIWFIVAAFQESVLWGLGVLIVPFVSLIFLVMHWNRAGKPFLLQIAGALPMVLGTVLAGQAA